VVIGQLGPLLRFLGESGDSTVESLAGSFGGEQHRHGSQLRRVAKAGASAGQPDPLKPHERRYEPIAQRLICRYASSAVTRR
jgi:hypothetical protein